MRKDTQIYFTFMPIYVYECRECSRSFEAEQRITEDPLVDCRLCSARASVKRVIQPVAVAFKGSGFHINDYSSTAKPSAPEAAPEPAKAAEPAKPD